jgi:RNase P subunit RPR2
MKKKISKTEAQKQIEEFFSNIQEKKAKEVKKIKRLAMTHNIKLGEKRKTFCKACYKPYIGPSIKIKNNMIRIGCEFCGSISRWKVK